MWLLVLQRLTVEFFLDILYFPIWWYTSGVKRAALAAWHMFQEGNISLAPGLWLRHIFTPMFGQTDWQGRIMSFFMRVVNIIGRSIALFVWIIVCLMVFSLWLVWPVFVVFMLSKSF